LEFFGQVEAYMVHQTRASSAFARYDVNGSGTVDQVWRARWAARTAAHNGAQLPPPPARQHACGWDQPRAAPDTCRARLASLLALAQDEFRAALADMGLTQCLLASVGSAMHVDAVFARLDVDRSGSLNLHEFIAFYTQAEALAASDAARDGPAMAQFNALANGQPFLDKSAFFAALGSMGLFVGLTPEQAYARLNEQFPLADVDSRRACGRVAARARQRNARARARALCSLPARSCRSSIAPHALLTRVRLPRLPRPWLCAADASIARSSAGTGAWCRRCTPRRRGAGKAKSVVAATWQPWRGVHGRTVVRSVTAGCPQSDRMSGRLYMRTASCHRWLQLDDAHALAGKHSYSRSAQRASDERPNHARPAARAAAHAANVRPPPQDSSAARLACCTIGALRLAAGARRARLHASARGAWVSARASAYAPERGRPWPLTPQTPWRWSWRWRG
jgi:hypothetical protein